jgi:molybdopterin-containing oxidoreductase family membrane subunit
MATKHYVMGLFSDEDSAAGVIASLRKSVWKLHQVNGPYPSHKIMDALKMKKSMVGLFTLGGGVTGFCAGYALAIYSSVQWHLIVSGKPVVSLIPFFVVGYEMTILFGILGTVLGMLLTARIPEFKSLRGIYDERCSGEHFGVTAACDPGKEDDLSAFFKERGGDVRVFRELPEAASHA